MLGTLLKFATPFVVHLLLFGEGGVSVCLNLLLLLAARGEVCPAVWSAADLLSASRHIVSLLCDSALLIRETHTQENNDAKFFRNVNTFIGKQKGDRSQ